jgi:WD40 repeat protein
MRVLSPKKGRKGFLGVAYAGGGRLLSRPRWMPGCLLWDLTTYAPGRDLTADEARAAPLLFVPGGPAFLRAHGLWPEGADLPAAPENSAIPAGLPPVGAWGRVSGWLSFSPDGRSVLKRSAGRFDWTTYEMTVWDLAGNCLRIFTPWERWSPQQGAFAPDGSRVAVGCSGHRVLLYDTATGARAAELAHGDDPFQVAFSPDGRLLATAAGRIVRLWDGGTGDAVARFPAFNRFARALAFSPDGRLLAAGSDDGHVRLWEPHSGRERIDFFCEVGEIEDIAFAPDGSTAAAAGSKSGIAVWDVDT